MANVRYGIDVRTGQVSRCAAQEIGRGNCPHGQHFDSEQAAVASLSKQEEERAGGVFGGIETKTVKFDNTEEENENYSVVDNDKATFVGKPGDTKNPSIGPKKTMFPSSWKRISRNTVAKIKLGADGAFGVNENGELLRAKLKNKPRETVPTSINGKILAPRGWEDSGYGRVSEEFLQSKQGKLMMEDIEKSPGVYSFVKVGEYCSTCSGRGVHKGSQCSTCSGRGDVGNLGYGIIRKKDGITLKRDQLERPSFSFPIKSLDNVEDGDVFSVGPRGGVYKHTDEFIDNNALVLSGDGKVKLPYGWKPARQEAMVGEMSGDVKDQVAKEGGVFAKAPVKGRCNCMGSVSCSKCKGTGYVKRGWVLLQPSF